MPQFHIEVTSSDGGIEGPDPDGIQLDDVGVARALVVETLIAFAKELPPPGVARTIAVTARDAAGDAVYTDSATVQGRPLSGPGDPAVWRAMAAMNRRT